MPLDDLRILISRHARDGSTEVMDGVRVSRSEDPSPEDVTMTGTVFALIAQGQKTLGLGSRLYEYRAGEYLVSSVDLPVSGQFTGASHAVPALGFGIALRPQLVADLLLNPAAADMIRARRGVPVPSGLAVSAASPDLIDAVARMLRLLDRPRDIPVVAPLIEREIVWLLMTGDQGGTVRQLGLADSGLSRIGRAVEWIREHYMESIRIEFLAQLAQMSTSAFHRGFQAVTALSPIQFQKQIRLQEARILLLAQPKDVAGAAYAVGYESASQFNREYRRQFGTPPGRDASRLRASAAITVIA
ncbi:AraC family transcriptional regulator [Frondihabitans sp. PAMC 28766]|uniref:AraC family transcriptional regulator n=1 Tax=Frondihabitans sp. PAMC 28766 TaxID=1795630 RepID=UPI00078D96F2|nr:AraC family transcriptional regulator [Frondihabitans sp. PAMC 28766]AMM18961.1 AraC family transcriptional regulator [Frondihabitans sp. PAMC 28766]